MLKICKISISLLFVNLYIVHTLTGSYIPGGTLIFAGVALAAMVIDIYKRKKWPFVHVKYEVATMFAFIFVAYATAPFVSYNTSVAFNALGDYVQKWIFCLIIFYICVSEGTIQFPIKLFLFVGLITAVISATRGTEDMIRLSLSENIGENGLGNLMVLLAFCLVMNERKKTELYLIFSILVSLLLMYVILLTGSRKSLYALGILFGLILLDKIVNIRFSRYISQKKLIIAIMLLISIFIVVKYMLPLVESTPMYARLNGEDAIRAQESNEGRVRLYIRAFEDFVDSPIFGIGFKNFSYKHGAYTHSAYAEVLACTGFVGIVLYFTTYVRTWISLKRAVKTRQRCDDGQGHKYVLYMFYTFLFIGLGIGHLYDNIAMLELGIFMASGCIAKMKEQSAI